MALAAGPKPDISSAAIPRDLDALSFAAWWGWSPYVWQRALLEEYCAPTRPRISYVQIARKNGKSAVAAAVAIDEMVRVGGQVFLIADSERNLKSALFHELNTMVANSPQLRGCVLQYKDHLECPGSGGRISLRPNNVGASQSINPDLVLFDEVHMQRTDSIWNGMALAGAASRRSLLLGITTPGYDITCLAHGLYEAVRAGDMHGHLWEPTDPNAALDDRVAILEGNPVLSDRPDMEDVFAFERTAMPEHDYRRFRLGQWTATASAWFPYGAWSGLADPARKLGVGEQVWLGFDGSYSGDSTALVGSTRDGHLVVLGVWENPQSRGRGWRVPRDAVDACVSRAFADFDVQAMYVDPPYWAREIADWDQRWPGKVVEFPTFSPARMAPACSAFYAAVMDKRLTHDGDPRLARHVGNAVVKTGSSGDVITKVDKDSPAKIDLAVAAVLAFQGAAVAPRSRDIGVS